MIGKVTIAFCFLWSCLLLQSYDRIIFRKIQLNVAKKSLQALANVQSSPNEVFWSNGLSFACTSCGKCCQREGEVWLDSEELLNMAEALHLSVEDFLFVYSERIVSGWTLLKSKVENGDCIFLDSSRLKCTVYESRPVQCTTYPYWPSLLKDKSKWNHHERNLTTNLTFANNEEGCEGINHPDASLVDVMTIHRNHRLFQMYNERFPPSPIGNDKDRLLSKIFVLQRIKGSTRAWVKDFVIKYNLCPFADQVFKSNGIRYAVLLQSKREEIIDRFKYEVFYLLANPNLLTTLLTIPLAFPDFQVRFQCIPDHTRMMMVLEQDFYEFSLQMEDFILPSIEKQSYGPLEEESIFDETVDAVDTTDTMDTMEGGLIKKRRTLKQRKSAMDRPKQLPQIQLAFFHPSFQWAGTDDKEPLNFEKRSPFPIINLLRADKIRAFANQKQTENIGKSNNNMLQSAGYDKLANEFDKILKIATQ